MKVLSCQGLSVRYERSFALEEVSFSISQGDYLCIVGENGSGKSTLLNTILGLLPPQSGCVTLGIDR